MIVLVLRSFQARALETSTALHAKQYVTTIAPKAGGDGQPLTLPGTLLGVIESTVYARSNGYVVRWIKDIGSSVKKGELLAEITAPEIDQELSQAVVGARAGRRQRELWRRAPPSAGRALREKDAVTQQDLDERLSAYNQAQANLAAADANVARLRKLQGFNQVVAPFDGVVTRRNVDVGDLVNAGNGGTGQALFAVAQVDPLRLYVYVPQVYAQPDQDRRCGDRQPWPSASGEQYQGTIARTARAIDTATRTMQVEIRVPNPKRRADRGLLRAGDAADQRRCPGAGGSHQCPAVSARGHARRIGRRQRPRALDRGETGHGFRHQRRGLERTQRQRSDHLESGGFARRRRCGDLARAAAQGRIAMRDCHRHAVRCGLRMRGPPCVAARLRRRPRLSPARGGGAAGLATRGAVARSCAERRRAEGQLVGVVSGRRR